MASVASRNPFDLLGESEEAESAVKQQEPAPAKETLIVKKVDRSRASPKEARIRHDYPQRGGFKPSTSSRNEDTRSAPRDRNVGPRLSGRREEGGGGAGGDYPTRNSRGARPNDRNRGGRGGRRGGREHDRHSGTGRYDSEKKETQAWGDAATSYETNETPAWENATTTETSSWDNTNTTETSTWKETTETTESSGWNATSDADANAGGGWGEDKTEEKTGWDADKTGNDSNAWVQQPEIEEVTIDQGENTAAVESTPVHEPEEVVKTFDEYLAEKALKSLDISLPEARKPNEGTDDSQWKDAIPLEKEDEEDFLFTGKVRAILSSQDSHRDYDNDNRDNRRRGGGRSGFVNIDDQRAFPSLDRLKMPQKTDSVGTSHANNLIVNGKQMFNGNVTSPEPINSPQQQNKTIVESTNSRRLSSATDRTVGMVSNPSRSNSRQTKNATSKVDDPVGNFRLSIDESVISALLDCAYADVKHEVLGYLGGSCDVDRSENTIVCRVSQFVASERIVTSLLTDEVQEMINSRENAIKIFTDNNLEFVGWYRSNFQSNSNSIPTQSDIIKNTAIQSEFPNSAGFIINISTTSCPSIGSKGIGINGLVNSISVFRTFESSSMNGDINNSVPLVNRTKTGKIWKGKGKANLKANKVSFNVNRQMYICPNVMQQLSCALMTILRETRQTYAGQVLECENRNGQRIFVDSQYESFLMNFLRKSVLQFDRSIDQDFRTLALAKLHIKSLISKRVNDTLAILQKNTDTNDNEKLSKRRKLDKLIEKLVTQRMDKREKEMRKLENGDDVVLWLNSKSQNDGKTVDEGSTFNNSALSKLEQSQKTSVHNKSVIESSEVLTSSISNHLEQKIMSTFKKESSILPQPNNTKLKNNKVKENVEPDHDVVVIESDSEISVGKSEGKPSKSLLRKPSLDSSQLNPISKRLKPSESSLPNVYYIESESGDSKSIFGSNHVQVNGTSSSLQSKGLQISPLLSKSSTYPPSSPMPNSPPSNIAISNNNPTGPNGIQYSQINYQYQNNSTNEFLPFRNGPEELNATIRSPTSPNDNKTVNTSQSSGIHLPSIQGLLEISSLASIQPTSPNSLPIVVVDPSSTIVQPSSFPTPPLLPSFQHSHYYSYSQQQAMSRTTSPPNTSPIQHHLLSINNNTSTVSTSTNSRHYIPIAPSPISTTTGGRNRPPQTLQTSTSTSIYANNTTNHLTFPATESDYQWQL
ncbi:2220_t:CDS:10 [Funneliformis mosseae]|uniref:2220_t:CDS:1 n=1 Tax=Funneliformis mosseae TaxID=27381 RepID=A0A9N8UWY5_FUNMO|nr:2220_t:CDS:10 [Funneliformis mosseae]